MGNKLSKSQKACYTIEGSASSVVDISIELSHILEKGGYTNRSTFKAFLSREKQPETIRKINNLIEKIRSSADGMELAVEALKQSYEEYNNG